MAVTDIYAGLDELTARQSNGDGNTAGGQVDDVYLRLTTPNYETNASDGSFGAPFGGPPGPNGMVLPVAPTSPPPIPIPGQGSLIGNMPQAEAISAAVMDLDANHQHNPSTAGANELFDFFGQILTHDVAEASTLSGDVPLLMDGLPFPFARTLGEVDEHGVRQQINEETSFLDLGMVYGDNDARLALARADNADHTQSAKLLLGDNGLLPTIQDVADDSGLTARQVLTIYQQTGFAGLPDPATAADGSFENIYYAGDNRATQQTPLVTLQTAWAREHNYQVDQLEHHLSSIGVSWTDDQKFEAARAITEAEWQHVVFDEYVPTLIGDNADNLLNAYKNFIGTDAYNSIGAGIINEWTTVAFRFGHDQSSNDYTVIDANGAGTVISLAQAFSALGNFAPDARADTTESIDSWIRGLAAQSAQEIDGKVADGNREALFGGLGTTVDLEAFDIQRGRDHGVWNYNDLRSGLGLSTYSSFDAYGAANHLDPTVLASLKSVYGDDITKLDSIVGGLLEQHYSGSQLGATFTLLSAIQFDLLQTTDAFYYENRLADNPELLAEIKGTTFAEILERNSGSTDHSGTVSHLHLDSFQVANLMEGSNKGDYMRGADIMSDADGNAFLKADLMIGGNGNDKIYGNSGNDTLYGDAGNDYLDGGKGDDFLRGGDGNDTAYGGVGNDNIAGEKGNDYLDLGSGDDWADGGAGNDKIVCGDGDDIALGKEGNDSIYGGKGNDQLFGGDGKDMVSGDAGDDLVYGGAGNDCVSGGAGNDTVHGEGDNDTVSGGNGNDKVYGDDGKDIVRGDAGNDACYGGAGDDCVYGGSGNDLIVGDAGNDRLSGGSGYDVFAFSMGSGKDKITDFSVKQDKIDLSELAQFDTFYDVQEAMTSNRHGTTINLGDTDGDGYNDTIELVGVSQKMLKDGNFILYHEDTIT